jgi:hypothetical protein
MPVHEIRVYTVQTTHLLRAECFLGQKEGWEQEAIKVAHISISLQQHPPADAKRIRNSKADPECPLRTEEDKFGAAGNQHRRHEEDCCTSSTKIK